MSASRARARTESGKVLLVFAAALVIALLLWAHQLLEGPRFSSWAWHRTPAWPLVALMTLGALPFFIAQVGRMWRGWSVRVCIGLMMVSSLALQVVSMATQENGWEFRRVVRLVKGALATSYFIDAQALVAEDASLTELLRSWPARMGGFTLHSREKPPMPVLFYIALLETGIRPDRAAMAGGLLIGVLATLAIPATYVLVRVLTNDREAAFAAASYLTLTPSLVVFLPQFDQWYPAFTCALLTFWVMAMRSGRGKYAIEFGVMLGLMCLWAYNMLVLGVFVVGYGVMQLLEGRALSRPNWFGQSRTLQTFAAQSVAALLSFAAFNVMLWIAVGFRPVGTFLAALHYQWEMPSHIARAWPGTVPTDLADFVLGMGWIAALLGVFYLVRRDELAWRRRVAMLCAAQVVIVALTGLLRGETARVWMFMIPLALVPAGLELARWQRQHRLAVYFVLWVLLVMVTQNLRFLEAAVER